MKKFLIRFFLSLCILLLSGYSLSYAYACESLVHPSFINFYGSTENTSLANRQQSFVRVNHAGAPHRKKKKFKIEATEVTQEEDEQSSSKRNVKNSHCFAAIFYNSLLADFFSVGKVAVPYSKEFSNISSQRLYLLFRIFRI